MMLNKNRRKCRTELESVFSAKSVVLKDAVKVVS